MLFTYLHLAAYPEVAEALSTAGSPASPTRPCSSPTGALPLLAPMSEVAGRMATQVGAHFLERETGGRGVLLGGVPGVRPARVVVVGAGNVGWNAAWIAAGMEAEVILLDKNLDRLRWVDQIHRGRIMTLASNRGAVERAVARGRPGHRRRARARRAGPDRRDRRHGRAACRPGAVIVDVAIDQGGCIEGIHETTHDDPVFERHGVLHYAVGNMPGAVPHTSTYALTNATLALPARAGDPRPARRLRRRPGARPGVNTLGGAVTHEAVADSLGRDHTPLADAFAQYGAA